MDLTLEAFAESVGADGDVTIEGIGSRDGAVPGVRVVRAPSGVTRVDAAEMVVECGAATPVEELSAALAEVGQSVSVPQWGTVGGALAVGRSDVTRLGHGALRDVLLMAHYVDAEGAIVKAGGPTVKNVSGFDLCRLLVGSVGSIGFLGTVLLRTRPLAHHTRWFRSSRDPFVLLAEVYRPVSILWDGVATWVRLDGDVDDVTDAARRHGLVETGGPPSLPPHRWSMQPGRIASLDRADGAFVAELGVGVVHRSVPQPVRPVNPALDLLHRRIADSFDPTDRLNPGRSPLRAR